MRQHGNGIKYSPGDGRLTLAIPEYPKVVERHKGLWILAAAGTTGGFNDAERP